MSQARVQVFFRLVVKDNGLHLSVDTQCQDSGLLTMCVVRAVDPRTQYCQALDSRDVALHAARPDLRKNRNENDPYNRSCVNRLKIMRSNVLCNGTAPSTQRLTLFATVRC